MIEIIGLISLDTVILGLIQQHRVISGFILRDTVILDLIFQKLFQASFYQNALILNPIPSKYEKVKCLWTCSISDSLTVVVFRSRAPCS